MLLAGDLNSKLNNFSLGIAGQNFSRCFNANRYLTLVCGRSVTCSNHIGFACATRGRMFERSTICIQNREDENVQSARFQPCVMMCARMPFESVCGHVIMHVLHRAVGVRTSGAPLNTPICI